MALDVGNSGIGVGFFERRDNGFALTARSRFSTETRRTPDEHILILRELMQLYGIDLRSVTECAVSCVVPELAHTVSLAGEYFTGCAPLWIGPGIHTGLNIRIDNHVQIGSDIVADTVAAVATTKAPAAIVDVGTVTAIAVADGASSLIGAILCPGLRTSMESMARSAALLNSADLARPSSLIGRNTADSVNSGVVNGHILMIDGFIREIRQTIPKDGEKLSLIATGGLADRVIPFCRNQFTLVPELTLLGIAEIYRRNT